jgi:flagellar biogenesis protein FliO
MTPWVFFSGHLVAALGVVAALVYFHGRLMRRFPESVE